MVVSTTAAVQSLRLRQPHCNISQQNVWRPVMYWYVLSSCCIHHADVCGVSFAAAVVHICGSADVYEVLAASHYTLLTNEEWDLATSENFNLNLPMKVSRARSRQPQHIAPNCQGLLELAADVLLDVL